MLAFEHVRIYGMFLDPLPELFATGQLRDLTIAAFLHAC